MSHASKIIGDRPTVRGTFLDEDGALADPSVVEVRVRTPSSDATTPYTHPHASITNVSTGVWDFKLPAAFDEVGKWYIYMVGSGGDGQGADQYVYDVRAPKMSLA